MQGVSKLCVIRRNGVLGVEMTLPVKRSQPANHGHPQKCNSREGMHSVDLLRNPEWVLAQPSGAIVVQIGANDHGSVGVSGIQDIVPTCIARGWRAVLLEPVPSVYRVLAARYRTQHPRVRTLNAAVCPKPTSVSPVDGCDADGGARGLVGAATMWHVDSSNATGNWGSDDADMRCITENGNRGKRYGYLLELTSFTAGHVLKHRGPGSSGATCMDCSRVLGRSLPHSCLQNVVWKNLRPLRVECACFQRELPADPIDLLFVDAEGHDDDVLARYPFHSHSPRRLVFEPKHLSEARFHALTQRLHRLGYCCLDELLDGKPCAASMSLGTSSWHRVQHRMQHHVAPSTSDGEQTCADLANTTSAIS